MEKPVDFFSQLLANTLNLQKIIDAGSLDFPDSSKMP
jgi:hypothetical protein